MLPKQWLIPNLGNHYFEPDVENKYTVKIDIILVHVHDVFTKIKKIGRNNVISRATYLDKCYFKKC